MSRLPSSFDIKDDIKDVSEMGFMEKIVYRSKQQPFVPLGCLFTTGAVALAALNVKSGNKLRAQFYFRWRVGLQAATLVALVAGSFFYGSTKAELKSKEDLMKQKAKMREQLWIQELERREEETEARRKKAEMFRLKALQNEAETKRLEAELRELELKIKNDSSSSK